MQQEIVPGGAEIELGASDHERAHRESELSQAPTLPPACHSPHSLPRVLNPSLTASPSCTSFQACAANRFVGLAGPTCSAARMRQGWSALAAFMLSACAAALLVCQSPNTQRAGDLKGGTLLLERHPAFRTLLGGQRSDARLQRPKFVADAGVTSTFDDRQTQMLTLVEQKLEQDLHKPGLCANKDLIISKLDSLASKLRVRYKVANETEIKAEESAKLMRSVWLEVESIYRMSQHQFDEATQKEEYIAHQLAIQKRVEELCAKNVGTIIEEYPG
eukprot:CAMPEP_0181333920 /NCGR_PEP_ID=MMETSP1101-20121128/25964_1 /TAXON_ID=46948 /ORGANISM="Rhodomonas abbreviata, Strain Caron Lab Isolate" /LENGTH=274 /DNA_ID=CAMNT_0023443823 /DNA_START=28 /DNA_END=848 /DNA_ORIENTATION=+